MTEDEEAPVLVCWPRKLGGVIVPGSVPENCTECGDGVWIAPSGQRMREEMGMTVMCVPCAGQVPGTRMPLTAEQQAEIRAMSG